MTFGKQEPSHLEIRVHCLLCGWVGEWFRKPVEAMQNYSPHLVHEHPDVLKDPTKMRRARREEFRYVGPDSPS